MEWAVHRQCATAVLERNTEGLARLRTHDGDVVFKGHYGAALAQYSKLVGQGRSNKTAILVHGLLGEHESFSGISSVLNDIGFGVRHLRYRSHKQPYAVGVRQLSGLMNALAAGSVVVGHSLGCRLISRALTAHVSPDVKFVLIAPPTKPVAWAQRGGRFAPVRRFLGAALDDLAKTPMRVRALERHQVTVIEGRTSGARATDGWLRSDETALPFAHERRIVRAGHRALLDAPEAAQIVRECALS